MDVILKEFFKNIAKVVFILFLIFIAFLILIKIIYGGSDTLTIGLILANLGYSWHISNQLQKHMNMKDIKKDLKMDS